MAAALLLGSGLAANVPADDRPQLADRYQEGLDQAWELADAGRLPCRPCTRVMGTAVSVMRNPAADRQARMEAVRAAEACYVQVAVLFIDRRLDAAERGETNCTSLIPGMAVHRSSLSESVEEIGQSRAEFDARI
ncbi:MAG: hypothetical protein PHQ14_11045, partial [Chromatiales bacterium]|nr:hypothetical protein [Chromatiales bacterium]